MKHENVSAEAEKLLGKVPQGKEFITKDGKRISSYHELKKHAKSMSQETFSHHVNDQKNDFHDWVKHVHKDHSLAKDIKKVKTPHELHKKVKQRVSFLERLREKELTFLKHHHMNVGFSDFVLGFLAGVTIGFIIAMFVFF